LARHANPEPEEARCPSIRAAVPDCPRKHGDQRADIEKQQQRFHPTTSPRLDKTRCEQHLAGKARSAGQMAPYGCIMTWFEPSHQPTLAGHGENFVYGMSRCAALDILQTINLIHINNAGALPQNQSSGALGRIIQVGQFWWDMRSLRQHRSFGRLTRQPPPAQNVEYVRNDDAEQNRNPAGQFAIVGGHRNPLS
jgi:hypothetical protein